jgi:hypothetical protein
MRGHYGEAMEKLPPSISRFLPIEWDRITPSPLHTLLNHSDCDGSIAAADCVPLADALEVLLPELAKLDTNEPQWNGFYSARTLKFVAGLRLAASLGEDVVFH